MLNDAEMITSFKTVKHFTFLELSLKQTNTYCVLHLFLPINHCFNR